jgi:hypothetical protein
MPDFRVRGKKRDVVFTRANHRCEYCQTPIQYAIQPFVVEHILPVVYGGTSDLDNLACACGGCNGHKYDKTDAPDPAENLTQPLFNPRINEWQEHFTWNADFTQIIGLSAIGRATVIALHLNRAGLVNIRRLMVLGGEHPPNV